MCAYEDESKCGRIKLEGAIFLAEFQRLEDPTEGQRDCLLLRLNNESSSASFADLAKGFTRTKALRGGVEAWQHAGYPMAA